MSERKMEVVEINGTKFEVDLSSARKIEEFRVGDKVKVLIKDYSDSYRIHPGIIIGFEWFKKHPTITIAYLKLEYKEANIVFLYYNSESKNVEISHTDNHELLVEPSKVNDTINKQVAKLEEEIADLKRKQSWFNQNFKKHFGEIKELSDLV